ncbi:hypothetical protein EPA93_46350 [Ktedonosporobacter rubrisoli]|uniref:Uncharacterized protein n=1 Tax=Ktedonosporobacter rubrisoli TaxID=2509675 RepID=A0A4P6K493_KTERU|nr:hypothetical protein [Ktedonosporobacter rubrisoli]QBD82994.1 hypothetical protein EPA93_46350 [Ktedonosporobacter rubrisoli]
MLNHALNMADLRQEAHQFCKRSLLKVLFKQGKGNVGFSRRDAFIYLTYGWFSLIATGAFLLLMSISWFMLLKYWFGDMLAWGVVLLIAVGFLFRELSRRKFLPVPHFLRQFFGLH